MADKKNTYSLKIVVPYSLKKRADKLIQNTRTSSVSNQIVILDDNSQQDSIIYTWVFNSMFQIEKLKTELVDRFSKEYFPTYHVLVS